MKHTKKLIEVALPLPEINDASAYDKMPGIGPHPKGIHQWWARLPLPTSRAVLFASIVDDPTENPEKWPTEAAQNAERERLFDIIRRMMGKKLHEHPEVYAEARSEMLKHCGGSLPAVFDPFAGGGSIPLEASRLGFEVQAGDLNPVAVLLNKCNLEFAPQWSGSPPVNPEDRKRIGGAEAWPGTHGLAADVRYYGHRIRDQARAKIGHLYPKARLSKEYGGGEASVIAWIWARTVASPDPSARGKHVPLVSTYWLSSKKGSEAWLEPMVNEFDRTWKFDVRRGSPKDRAAIRAGTKVGRAVFACILTGAPIGNKYIDEQANGTGLRFCLIATIADGKGSRIYLPADATQESATRIQAPANELLESAAGTFAGNAVGLPYGFKQFRNYFTARQLTAMVTLSDLIRATGSEIRGDATAAGLTADRVDAYTSTLTTFLALALDRCADFNNSLCRWKPSGQQSMNLFGRQAIPMVWDFVEPNILGEKAVCWHTAVNICADAIETISANPTVAANVRQLDAASSTDDLRHLLVSTDPPYYDNIGYAALSDFFYVWLRRTIGDLYPDIFATVLTPKLSELTASPQRYGNRDQAKERFETGFLKAFAVLREKMDPCLPLTVYYAFKQDDEDSGADDQGADESSGPAIDRTTGWETMLEALIGTGFQITATWPVRASQKWRMVSMGTNALASYIVLACRPRPAHAMDVDRRSFVAELKQTLPTALRHLQQGNVAPVDFAQAAIGPGMAIFSRYRRVLESSGKAMTVRSALSLINQTLTEVLSEREDEFDAETRWAIAWFEQYGFDEEDFGEAELLSKAKVTSVAGLQQAGVIHSRRGMVRLLRPEELRSDWEPAEDQRLTIWEMTHHLLRIYFHQKAGDQSTADLLRKLGSRGEIARDLAYRLFDVCEKKKRSQEAQAYNALVLGWPEVARLAREGSQLRAEQATLFANAER